MKERIREDVKSIADGENIPYSKYRKEGAYNRYYIQKHFDGFHKLKKELGLVGLDKEEVIEDMKIADEETTGVLSMDKYGEVGKFSPQIISRKFGWNDIKEEAGLDVSRRSESTLVTKINEVISMLENGETRKSIAEEIGLAYSHFINELREKGISIRNAFTKSGENTFIISLSGDDLEELGFDTDQSLYYEKSLTEDGIVIKPVYNRVDVSEASDEVKERIDDSTRK